MKKFKEYLIEISYTKEDIPKTFRVAMEWDYKDPENTGKMLADHKLPGMTGISSNGQIAFQWWGVGRDILLIMPGKKVVELNGISRILYDNPHYMLSKNMTMLRRLFNASFSKIGTRQTFFNLNQYFFKQLGKTNRTIKYNVEYCAAYQTLANLKYSQAVKVSSPKDYIKYFRRAIEHAVEKEKNKEYASYCIRDIKKETDKISDSELISTLKKTFEYIKSIYGTEEEWIIKDRILNVPKGSRLYILWDKKFEKSYKEAKEKTEGWHHAWLNLKKDSIEKMLHMKNIIEKYLKDYKVKLVDREEFDKARGRWFEKKTRK